MRSLRTLEAMEHRERDGRQKGWVFQKPGEGRRREWGRCCLTCRSGSWVGTRPGWRETMQKDLKYRKDGWISQKQLMAKLLVPRHNLCQQWSCNSNVGSSGWSNLFHCILHSLFTLNFFLFLFLIKKWMFLQQNPIISFVESRMQIFYTVNF